MRRRSGGRVERRERNARREGRDWLVHLIDWTRQLEGQLGQLDDHKKKLARRECTWSK